MEAPGSQVVAVSYLRLERVIKAQGRYPAINTTVGCRDLIANPTIDAIAIATPVSTFRSGHADPASWRAREGVAVNGSPESIYQALISYRTGDIWAPLLDMTEALLTEVLHFIRCIEQGEHPSLTAKLGCG